MGCGGSKPEGSTGAAGSPPKGQPQGEAAKDAAAAEIQKAAKSFKDRKDKENEEKRKDDAAAEIQGGAAAYLKKKREEKGKAADEPAAEGGGIIGAIAGIFSQREPAPAAAA